MALESSTVPELIAGALNVQRKFNQDLGREITWHLVAIPLSQIELNARNNRIAPSSDLTEEEHEEAIIQEDVQAFENLTKSWESNPQFEQLIGYTDSCAEKVKLIAGHRRYFAAKKSTEKPLVWVAQDLTAEEVEHIRDWPEIHPTKVPHSSFARYKSIYLDICGLNDLDREKRINKWKLKGYTRQQILKAERVYGRLDGFCKELNEKSQQRSAQIKSFEAYDQICETTFKTLQDQGDYEKVCALDKIAKAFLKETLAHDDLKVTVEGLAEFPINDPVYTAISSDPTYLQDVSTLRRLTNLARAHRNSVSVTEEVKDFCSRIFSKLVDRADQLEIETCLQEFQSTSQRIHSALLNLRGES